MITAELDQLEKSDLSDQDRNDLAAIVQDLDEKRLASASIMSHRESRPISRGEDQELFSRLRTNFAPTVRADFLGPWDTGYITFPDGIAVGGFANLTLHRNGAYNFSGHAHVSGAVSYNWSFAWAVRDSNVPATVYVFATNGRLHGTFESGSRDHDWGESQVSPALAAGWPALERQWAWNWDARVNADFGVFLDQIIRVVAAGTAIGNVVKFIASDARAKEEIRLLFRRADGIGIYTYRYRKSPVRRVGVIAQEVAETVPGAVRIARDGLMRVDYDRLGLSRLAS